MKIIIHRGTREIGGTCIELISENSRILVEFGIPLVDEDRRPFDSDSIKNKNLSDLLKLGILPDINGLYKGDDPAFNTVLLSHPHPDHYGLLGYIHPSIPIILSQGCKEVVAIANLFGQTHCDLSNTRVAEPWKEITIGDFKVTPYLVDHSGFDAFSYLIEADDKRVFYSGDFRGHGRKMILFENIIKNPPENIDYLILEGTLLERNKGDFETENDVEDALVDQFKNNNSLFVLACSSQNIDRLVSAFRACVRTGRIFVIDPYTAYVLDKLKTVSKNLPQFDWGKNIKVFFVPNSYTKKLADNHNLYKFKSAKITIDEIEKTKSNLLIKDSFMTRKILGNRKLLDNTKLIYSMWEGYLKQSREFWDNHNVEILQLHTSGHAYVDELISFADALQPKHIIPNHTFYPEMFPDVFKNHDIISINDGEEIDL